VVARSHDLTLHSRVLDFQPEHLNSLLYEDRKFFDFGGLLMIYPMSELPYWRLHMKRDGEHGRWAEFAEKNPALIDEVRGELRSRGPLGHRDLKGHARVESYRARKDTGLALYYLWRIGELMTHSRRRFDRLYYFTESIAPPELQHAASDDEAEDFFARRALIYSGLGNLRAWRSNFSYMTRRTVTPDEARQRLDALVQSGHYARVAVDGWKEPGYLYAEDLPLLEALQAERIPDAWQPLDTTTDQEVTFLAPLDPVSARGRATKLFDFEYIWEVYKPAEQRRWGYYTMPILYGGELVARFDPKLDRPNKTLMVKGFWLERPELGKDAAFAAALARGLARFTRFHGVDKLDVSAIKPASLRSASLFKRSGISLQRTP
jgi:uncharacterized protein YcaQ